MIDNNKRLWLTNSRLFLAVVSGHKLLANQLEDPWQRLEGSKYMGSVGEELQEKKSL